MIGDREPKPFQKGQHLTAAALNSLVDSVVVMLRKMFGRRLEQPLNLVAVLDEDLDAATDGLTTPSTAVASIIQKDTNGDYHDTGRNETVVNRFEGVSISQYTMIRIEWLDAEWQPYAADCDALSNWPPEE